MIKFFILKSKIKRNMYIGHCCATYTFKKSVKYHFSIDGYTEKKNSDIF